jgi:LPXTG-motif cell wall-anchored protein
MDRMHRNQRAAMAAACVLVLVAAAPRAFAQATASTEVKSGEVVYVSGNDLVVRMSDGSVKHFNVPATARFTVDGKQLTASELKVGTKLTQTITTTSTPENVTTVRTVSGRVVNVSAPYVTLRLADGQVKQYKVPEGTTFNIDGDKKTVSDLRANMNVSATVTTVTPQVNVSQTNTVTGVAPPPPAPAKPATPPIVGVLLIEEAPRQVAVNTPAPSPAAPQLPKTGTFMPALGMLGLLLTSAGLLLRRRS